jgi:hypothetical protein
VRISNGRAQGDATAFVVEGPVDTNTGQLDLRVSVIPSYYGLNTAPQKIPVLGSLVAKATGEAVQVIDTRITGPFSNPKVSIEPISMLAPEIVKETIEHWRTPRRGRGGND